MTEITFDHDRLDVYRLSIEYTAESQAEYTAMDDYEHEHRYAEHEHEHEEKPEQQH